MKNDIIRRAIYDTFTKEQIQRLIDNDVSISDIRRYIAEHSIHWFIKLYFADEFNLEFADVHLEMIEVMESIRLAAINKKAGVKEVLAIPRGHSKSTFFSRILPLHAFLFNWSSHTILLGANDTAAKDKLGKIINDIESNELLLEDFPEIKGKVFGANRIENNKGYAIGAFGAGSMGIRGQFNPTRPTLVVADDLDNDESIYSSEVIEKYINWWNSTVLPIGDNIYHTTSFIMVGTVLAENSVIKRVIQSVRFNSRVYPAILNFATNVSLWNEWEQYYFNNQPKSIDDDIFYNNNKPALLEGSQVLWDTPNRYYELMKIKLDDNKSFYSEYQNQPLAAGTRLGEHTLVKMPTDLENWELYISVDPTVKGGKTNDLSAIVQLLFNRKSKQMIVIHVDAKQRSYDDTIAATMNTIINAPKRLSGILIEDNGIGAIAVLDIQKLLDTKYPALYYKVKPITNKLPKLERIDMLSTYIPRAQLAFIDTISPEVITDVQTYPYMKYDDRLDAIALVVLFLKEARLLDLNS